MQIRFELKYIENGTQCVCSLKCSKQAFKHGKIGTLDCKVGYSLMDIECAFNVLKIPSRDLFQILSKLLWNFVDSSIAVVHSIIQSQPWHNHKARAGGLFSTILCHEIN